MQTTTSSTIYDLLSGYDNVEYQLTPRSHASTAKLATVDTPTTCVVKGVLLRNTEVEHDAILHVLVPETHVIGLDNLNLLLSGEYQALSEQELEPLLLENDVLSLPSIPRWQRFPCLIDSSVFMYDSVLLDPGSGAELVELGKRSFYKLVSRCLKAQIASPIPSLKDNSEQDESDIKDSLSQFTQRRIKQRLEETLELPPIPRTTQKIIALRADPEADIDDLVQAVEIDPSLAAQVVSWAASPYYSAPGEIKSIHDAIVRVLGFDMVLNMALGLTLGQGMSMKSLSASEVQAYWREAVLVASTTEALVALIPAKKRPERGLAYLAGLLSNFGTLVMSEVFPLYHKQIKRIHAANPHCDQAEIELYALGTCGQQIASWLLNQWSMPKPVCEAIRQSATSKNTASMSDYCRLLCLSKALLAEVRLLAQARTKDIDTLLDTLEIDREKASEVIERIVHLEDEFMSFSTALAR